MTATNQNFEMYAGDTKNLVVTVTNPDGTAVNLTGATVKWAMITSATTKLQKGTDTGGITVNNPTGGVFTVSLASSDTSGLSGNYFHESVIIDAIGNKSTILIGTAKIYQNQL